MTTNKRAGPNGKKSRVKVNKLKLNKETVKELTGMEANRIKGGALRSQTCGDVGELNAAVRLDAESKYCVDVGD